MDHCYFTICQETDDDLEEINPSIDQDDDLFNIVLDSRYESERYQQSAIFPRDMVLSEEHGPNLVLSMFPDDRVDSLDALLRNTIVPAILSFARGSNNDPRNYGRHMITLVVEIDDTYQQAADGGFDQVIDLSMSYVNFRPATRSAIRALKRMRYSDDEEDDHDDHNNLLPLKKRRRSVEGLSSRTLHKECSICLDEFSDGEEVALMPCEHVFHDACIVRWLENSHLCPLCRYKMPIRLDFHR